MNMKKIAAIAAAAVMAAGIVTGVPMNSENVPTFSITAKAADSKLAAPKNLKAAAGDGKITLTWDKVTGADAYRVYLYNVETKKYEKYKLIKGTKTTITGLENGKTYKFKVAAAVKSGKSYRTGKASAAVSAKPKAAKKASAGSKLTEVTLKTSELKGTWEYYDFLYLKKYTSGAEYDPQKREFEYAGMFSSVYINDASNAVLNCNEEDFSFFNFASISKGEFSEPSGLVKKYKTYSCGDDKYMFVQFINGDGENTYVFKKSSSSEKKKVTDISELEGKWTGIEFLQIPIDYAEAYDPKNKYWLDTLWLKSASVKDGKINIKTADDSDYFGGYAKIEKNNIGDSKYAVYEINNDMYLFIEFVNGDGNNIYVLKKD